MKAAAPIYVDGQYTSTGKWMDGWETRRRRTPGFDWCLIRLGLPARLRGIVVDTSHFRGNYPERCSLEACGVDGNPAVEQLASPETEWLPILPPSPLKGDSQNAFAIDSPYRFTHLWLKIYPDGGVARLRVYGEPLAASLDGSIDLAAMENGGRVLSASDMFFSSRHNLLRPGPSLDMGDGWETKRRRGPGHDWVVIQLAEEGCIESIEVDTSHFKGNFPESCSLEACDAEGHPCGELMRRTRLQAHTRHLFEEELHPGISASHVRFSIYPDGGVARLRLYGSVTEAGRLGHKLQFWNALPPKQAEARLLRCCGSGRWAHEAQRTRPFASVESMLETTERVWWSLSRQDWLEAFAAHPQIGEPTGGAWSRQEQACAGAASSDVLEELAQLNARYRERFGYIYIVCATGKSAAEMLAILRSRLGNDPETELPIAAGEQSRITRLRLVK